jgi:hypothetical protein
MIAKCIPGQLPNGSVILMIIMLAMSKDNIWSNSGLELVEILLDLTAREREVRFMEPFDFDFF